MRKLLDKWNNWEQANYVSALKGILGILCAVPTVGIYGVVQAYFTRNLTDLLTCVLVVVCGTVLSTLFALVVLNEHQDERYASVRRHPVAKRVR